ncbi:putative membrane protein [Arcanobacterium wilhelmae]|uniref:Membrane protein n=1 Tax=Arcanobacterium wilhelmae TaxID=1803177 RepID=A0ABT9NAL0_9ACTO|nr:YhgE/Pip domain-containing protein [Arcanobacterium wilhelmae]MDP9800749.1 putative membrane protein [Arcanobacterium wilhelmae]
MMTRMKGPRLATTIVLIAVFVIPLLYAGLLTMTYQNPTHRLNKITAAVVNEDQAYIATLITGKSEELNLGKELTDALTDPKPGEDVGFTWKRMDKAQAEREITREGVRAILYIPSGFTREVARVGGTQPTSASTQTLRLVTDDGVNYLAGTLAKSVASQMTERINARGADRILGRVLLSVDEIRSGMRDASDGAAKLADGTGELTVGIGDLEDGSVKLETGITALRTGADKAANGSSKLADGLGTLDGGVADANAGAAKLADGTGRLTAGTSELDAKAGELATGVGKLTTGSGTLADGVRKYTDGVGQAGVGVLKIYDNAIAGGEKPGLPAALAQLKAGVGTAGDFSPSDPASAQTSLAAGIAGLQAGLGQLSGSLAGGQETLAGGAQALAAGADKLQAGIAGDGKETLAKGSSALVDGLAKLQAGVNGIDTAKFGEAVKGAAALQKGVADYTGGVEKLAGLCKLTGDKGLVCAGLAQLAAKNGELNAGATQLAGGLTAAGQGIEQLGTLSQGVDQLSAGAKKLQAGIGEAGKGAAALNQGAAKLAAGAQAAGDGAAKLSAGADQLGVGAVKLSGGIDQLAASVGAANSTDPNTLAGALNALRTGVSELSSKSGELTAGADQLRGGLGQLNGNMPALTQGVGVLKDGATQLNQGAGALSHGLGKLKAGSATAAGAANQLATGLDTLANGTLQAVNGASALADGSTKAKDGAAKLDDGATKLADGLREGTDKIPALSQSDRDNVANTASNIVKVDPIRGHAVANDGAGFTPMFMSLALWIGTIALFLVLPALDKAMGPKRWVAAVTRPATTATLIAIVQAAVMMLVVNWMGELHASNIVGLTALAILSSICFMAINQACVAAFAFRGRFLSIVLLCLQITTMGATFPIETAPAFFQWVHPFLSMSDTQLAFRSMIAGSGVDGIVGRTVLVLVMWTIVAFAISLFASKVRLSHRAELPADEALAPTAA